MSKIVDLVDTELIDGTVVSVWKDEELVYVQLGFVTFGLPEYYFKDFAAVLTAAANFLSNNKEDVKAAKDFIEGRERILAECKEEAAKIAEEEAAGEDKPKQLLN